MKQATLVAAGFGCAVAILGSTGAWAKDTVCDDMIMGTSPTAPVTITGNVVVPAGKNCMMIMDAIITGNVTFQNGSCAFASDAEDVCMIMHTIIGGNLTVQNGASVEVHSDDDPDPSRALGSVIAGNYTCNNCMTVHLHDSTVMGNFQVNGLKDGMDVMNSIIGGNLDIHNSTFGPRDMFMIMDNMVNGNVTFNNNTGHSDIMDNVIGGNLQCQNNSPAPSVDNNTAKSAKGQCAAP